MLRRGILAVLEKHLFSTKVIKRYESRSGVLETQVTELVNSDNLTKSCKSNQEIVSKLREELIELDNSSTRPEYEDNLESIIEEIAKGDGEVERQLRLLSYEISIKREEGARVPNHLKKAHWEELLQLSSQLARMKYLSFLFKNEKIKEAEKIKHKIRVALLDESKELVHKVPHIYYGISAYSMFLRLYNQHLLLAQHIRSLTNSLFAPPILFDCSYQKYMNRVNTKYCAKQIAESYNINKLHQYPCSIQLVNLEKNGMLMEYINLFYDGIESATSINITEKSYLDLYPKEKLLYLTPHTTNELIDFKLDDIYIIGAFVDKGVGTQASLAKAKEEGLRMAKFPLDRYLLWKSGSKSLALNHVLNILLDMRYYMNWRKAFRSIPKRHLI